MARVPALFASVLVWNRGVAHVGASGAVVGRYCAPDAWLAVSGWSGVAATLLACVGWKRCFSQVKRRSMEYVGNSKVAAVVCMVDQ